MPGLGWVLPRSIYKVAGPAGESPCSFVLLFSCFHTLLFWPAQTELQSKWPAPDKKWDWFVSWFSTEAEGCEDFISPKPCAVSRDMWIRMPEQLRGRECLVPEVPRTFHFGTRGVNMNAYFQSTHFSSRRLHGRGAVAFPPVSTLEAAAYDAELSASILAASPWKPANPCNATGPHGGAHVFYIQMHSAQDMSAWQHLATCWKIWNLDPRGYHKR